MSAFQRIPPYQRQKLLVGNYTLQMPSDQFFHLCVLTKACPSDLVGIFLVASQRIIFLQHLGLQESHFPLQYHKCAIQLYHLHHQILQQLFRLLLKLNESALLAVWIRCQFLALGQFLPPQLRLLVLLARNHIL